MFSSRRTFFGTMASALAVAAAGAAQTRSPRPTVPYSGEAPLNTNPNAPQPNSNSPLPPPTSTSSVDPRVILTQNQQEIRKDVARLTELVSELQKGLDENDTKDVLSLDQIHKTEEIEKLAKKIRGLIRS